MEPTKQAITRPTWTELVRLSAASVASGWATPGVFATAIGSEYEPGTKDSLFYVGKSGGPRIDEVGLCTDQAASSVASQRWMVERRNPSAFWVFADLMGRRESMAWSNLAKIDSNGSGAPNVRQWRSIEDICLKALAEELEFLVPGKSVFAVSNYHDDSITGVLRDFGFAQQSAGIDLESTRVFAGPSNRLAVITRHAQGWPREARDSAARFIRDWPLSDSRAA